VSTVHSKNNKFSWSKLRSDRGKICPWSTLDTLSENQIDDFLHVRPFSEPNPITNPNMSSLSISASSLTTKASPSPRSPSSCSTPPLRHLANPLWQLHPPRHRDRLRNMAALLRHISMPPCRTVFGTRVSQGICIPTPPMWYANASLNIATDLAIFVLPQRRIYALILPKGQKISFVWCFCSGILVMFPISSTGAESGHFVRDIGLTDFFTACASSP